MSVTLLGKELTDERYAKFAAGFLRSHPNNYADEDPDNMGQMPPVMTKRYTDKQWITKWTVEVLFYAENAGHDKLAADGVVKETEL